MRHCRNGVLQSGVSATPGCTSPSLLQPPVVDLQPYESWPALLLVCLSACLAVCVCPRRSACPLSPFPVFVLVLDPTRACFIITRPALAGPGPRRLRRRRRPPGCDEPSLVSRAAHAALLLVACAAAVAFVVAVVAYLAALPTISWAFGGEKVLGWCTTLPITRPALLWSALRAARHSRISHSGRLVPAGRPSALCLNSSPGPDPRVVVVRAQPRSLLHTATYWAWVG